MRRRSSVNVRLQCAGTTLDIVVTGVVDADTVHVLAQASRVAVGCIALPNRPRSVVINLQDVEFLETGCVGSLLDTMRQAVAAGMPVMVLPPQDSRQNVLDLRRAPHVDEQPLAAIGGSGVSPNGVGPIH